MFVDPYAQAELNALISALRNLPIPGRELQIWEQHAKSIQALIRENDLKPVTTEVTSATGGQAKVAPTTAGMAESLQHTMTDFNIRGGILSAHLHFEDRIYMLNSKQWAKFSQSIIADCKAALGNVKEVSFDQGMAIGSLTSTLTQG